MATERTKRAIKVGFYDIEKTIGKGNFAVVKLARHRVTKSQVSVQLQVVSFCYPIAISSICSGITSK